MVLSLVKGQKIDLTKNNPDLNLLHIGLDWNSPSYFDIDVSTFLLGQDEKIVREEDFVFYGQPSSSNDAVSLEGPSSINEKQHFIIDLPEIPDEVQKIAFTLSIYESELNGYTFKEVSSLQLRIVNSSNEDELATFLMKDSFTKVSAIVLGHLYRYAGEWKFQAVGDGFFGGLAALCHEYGVEVEDQPVEETPNHPGAETGEEPSIQDFQEKQQNEGAAAGEGIPTGSIESSQLKQIPSHQTMKDYIAIPDIVEDVKEVHSEKLINLFENSTIHEGKISLDFLRETYKTDRTSFIHLVDELSLRGFRFITEKPTNILPNSAPQTSTYIEVHEEGTRFKNINLSGLGIGGLIQRFHVKDDLFFHKIPLNGFNFLNANIDIESLEEEFLHVGFGVTTVGEARELSVGPDTVKEEDGSTELASYANPNEEITSNVTIDQLFEENKYKLFRNFCQRKKITYIAEITDDVLERFRTTPGVGSSKVCAVEERLEEFKNLGTAVLPEEAPDPEEPFIQLTNKYAGNMEITQLFYENGFNKFRLFCQEKGLTTVGEIKRKHIEKFSTSPGIGRKKVQDVIKHLQSYAITAENNIPLKFEAGELFDSIKQWPVSSLLKVFGYQSIPNSSVKIEDMQGENFEKFEGEFDERTLIDFSNKLLALKLPNTIAGGIPEILKDQQKSVIDCRFVKKWTLEESGQLIGVTRERVRQVEAKALRKIYDYLEVNQFSLIVRLLSGWKTLIPEVELLGMIGEENSYLMEVLKDKRSIFTYFDKLNVFCCNPEECQDFHEIEAVILDLPEQFFLNEVDQLFEETLEKIGVYDPTIEMIQQLLDGYGLNRYGELYTKSKLSLVDILALLFRKYIKEPLHINETSIELLKQLALEHLDYQLEGSVRSIDARIRDVNEIILVDSNTFQWFDSENFDQTIISLVDDYLKKRFLEVKVINIEEVFKTFEEQLIPYKIFNKLHLYSIVRFFLDDEYSIGKGNTLNIYQNDENRLNVEQTMIEAIRSLGGTCLKTELQELLRIQMYRIENAISGSKQLIPWGTNQITLFDQIGLTEVEVAGLSELVDRTLKDGWTTIGNVYKELMFDSSLSGLISKKGIDSKTKLAAVIKNIKPSISGHTNFMYEDGCSFTSFEDVILDHFKEGASRREIQEFAKENGYGDVMASNLIGHLLEQEVFIEVDLDLLYPANHFDIPVEVVDTLIAFIEEQMAGKEYLSLHHLKGYRRKLPPIEFRWNPFLMRSILVKHGFRQIQKIYRDYRYDKILIVRVDSKVTTFVELVYHVLKEEYEGNMHEVNVYDFLVQKGILREQEYDHEKVLPYEIKENSNLISVDSIGIVVLK